MRSMRVPQLDPKRKHTHRGGGGSLPRAPRGRASGWPSRSRPRIQLSGGHRRVVFPDNPGARTAAVLEPPRLPGVRLLGAAARAAHVLVQQPGRRLPDLRRPWHSRSSSIPSGWWCTRTCRWPAARCAAGTGAMRIISRCCSRSRGTTNSTSKRPGCELPENVQRVLLFGSGEEQIEFRYSEGAGTRGRKRHTLRGHRAEPRAPLSRDRLAGGARGAAQVPRHARPASTAAVRA